MFWTKKYINRISLSDVLGFRKKTLYFLTNHIYKNYHKVEMPKSDGSIRTLHVPCDLLKAVQRRINDKLLSCEEISKYATAYRVGGSTLSNASPHVDKQVVLKLDITHFFDHLIYPVVKEKAFPKNKYSEKNRILLTLLCIYKEAIPQGAPTSPAISNIIMKDFDNTVGKWCEKKKIAYTRYCDDMTFSGNFNPKPVIKFVKKQLKNMGLYLNEKKTVIARKGQKQRVTGIVVNEKLGIPSEYKRRIRQEIYYCKKFGISSHLERMGRGDTDRYLSKLLGKINYVLAVEPDNIQMQENKIWVQEAIQKRL